MNRRYLSLSLFFFIFFTFLVFKSDAAVKLPAIFGDNMILQQSAAAAIWGEAKAGANVTVVTSWNKRKYSVASDDSGHWKIKVATPTAGGPYTITISDGTPVVLHNVL